MKRDVFWKDPSYEPKPPLAGEEKAHALVVGGGVGGLFAAHFLLERGVGDIVLIEKNEIGSGSTGHSAGMLVAEIETAPWERFAEAHGVGLARLYFQVQEAALFTVRDLVRERHIECEYDEEEFLFLARSRESMAHVEAERALRSQIGALNTILTGGEALDEFGSPYVRLIEKLERAASVNPLLFAHGMRDHLVSRGIRVYEETSLVDIGGGKARTENGSIAYDMALLSRGTREAHAATRNLITTICVTRKLTSEELRRARLEDRDMFLDMERRSYHYGKVTSDGRLLVGYGDVQDDAKGEVELHMPHVDNIARFLRRFFGIEHAIDYAWSGRYALSEDTLPFFEIESGVARIGGAGTQLSMIALASYAAARLTGSEHPLSRLF